MDFLRQFDDDTFSQLQHRPQALHQVETRHRHRHAAARDEVGGPTAAPEVLDRACVPRRRLKALLDFPRRDFPVRLHHRLAVAFLLPGRVQRRRAGVDEVQEPARRATGQFVAGHALDGLRTPVRAHIGKHLRRAGEQMPEKHREAVEGVVLRRHDVGLADAVPVERRVEDGLHKVAVGEVVGPLALPLETGGDGVVPQRLLLVTQFRQARVAHHQIAGDERHLDRRFPVFILLRAAALLFRWIAIRAFGTVRFDPGHGLLKLDRIVDVLFETADELRHVHKFRAHAEILLEKPRLHDGTGYPH